MLDGAVLTLADECRAGENDGEQGDAVDELDNGAEPGLAQFLIEERSLRELHLRYSLGVVLLGECSHLVVDDGLDVAAAGERLSHARRIDIELDLWRAPGEQIALKMGRDVQGEGVDPGVHSGVHLGLGDHYWRQEPRRLERVGDAP